MATHSIAKIWRKAKVIAIEKPGKDPSLAANYRSISPIVLITSLLVSQRTYLRPILLY